MEFVLRWSDLKNVMVILIMENGTLDILCMQMEKLLSKLSAVNICYKVPIESNTM